MSMQIKAQPALSLLKGDTEINIHSVSDGQVYYGIYSGVGDKQDGLCVGLYRLKTDDFDRLLKKALADGSTPFTRVDRLAV